MAVFSAVMGSVQLLCYDADAVPEGGQHVVSSPAPMAKACALEPAGLSFHEVAKLQLGVSSETEAAAKDATEETAAKKSDSASVDASAWESSRKGKKSGKDGKGEAKEQDHYALLGLGHLRFLATEDQIRRAYRDAALKFHPDKLAAALLELPTEEAKAARKEEVDSHFKAVQLAYEVLSDPSKRRVFDSTDEFDDEVPDSCAPQAFFKVFGPVFARNAKWAAAAPSGGVPELGGEDSAMEEVDRFYDFWFAFKSWREFPNEDEYELESAESREHKRWMERQNAKLREKARKEEAARIRTLVENAYRRDPRIARRKEEEKREKQRKKEEKARERVAKEEEEKRREEEERRRKEEEEKKAAEEAAVLKKQREKEKKLVRKERARLRAAVSECIASAASLVGRRKEQGAEQEAVSEEEVEELCQALELEKLRAACEQLEGAGGRQEKLQCVLLWLRAARQNRWEGHTPSVNGAEGGEEGGRQGEAEGDGSGAARGAGQSSKAEQKKEGKEGKEGARPWGREEVEHLKRLVAKIPRGTAQRWEVIAEQLGTERTADEVVRASKTVMLQKPDDKAAFDSFLLKRKPPKDIASPLSSRDDVSATSSPPASTHPSPAPGPASLHSASCPALSKLTPSNSSSSSSGAAPGAAMNGHATHPAAGPKEAAAQPPQAPAAANGSLPGSSSGGGGSPPSSSGPLPGGAKAPKKAAAVAAAEAAPAAPPPAAAEATAEKPAAGGAAEDAWSAAQEMALVKALKAFPKDTDKRWDRVAAAVPGKTKAQCFKKFSALRSNFRSMKAGGPAE